MNGLSIGTYRMRRIVRIISLAAAVAFGAAAIVVAVAWFAQRQQEAEAAAVMTADIARLPVFEVGLVLGTAPFVRQWPARTLEPNPTFAARLDSAAALWRDGKVKYLIVSGNAAGRYDEPTAMRAGLIARGVPAQAIYRDPAGFRTLDSMLRARDVFGLKRLVVISQDFHIARALFLARAAGIEAWGFEAATAPSTRDWREELVIMGSALLAYVDVWRGRRAREVGQPIAIGADQAN